MGQGGGVGFYINSLLKFKRIVADPPSSPRTFENICLEIIYNNPIIISNIYRSPNPNIGTSITEHLDQFLISLDTHLTFLNSTKKKSFVLTDANINLAVLNQNQLSHNYFNTVLSNGFLPLNTKATRIQGNTHSLIDHILSNSDTLENINIGTIISDISDHFMNFFTIIPPSANRHHKTNTFRDMNPTNIENFRSQLSNLSWHNVLNSTDVNTSLELFWNDFKTLFDLNFPTKTTRLNNNTHKINSFMTQRLLISRNNRIRLHKLSLVNPSEPNVSKYRTYRNMYNSVLRHSKKHYFETNLKHHAKNPKKTWDILKEAIKTKSNSSSIDSIIINGRNITEKTSMANEFNSFFTTAGSRISETVNPTLLDPNNFIPPNPNPPLLELGQVSPAVIVTTIKAFISETSTDIDGLSTKLLKAIAVEISQPLSHIFNLSITTGVFPGLT
jgi:hypothetical protein